MKLIRELFTDAENQRCLDRYSFMYERRYKKLLEQWILGKFIHLYNKNLKDPLVYAESLKPPDPDFRVFDGEKNWIVDIDVTEALDKGRKRNKEYRNNNKSASFKGFIPDNEYLSTT